MDIIAMHRNGYSIRKIAKLHGIHRDTVKRHLESNSFPEYQKEKRKISILGPYSQIIKDYLDQDDYQATWIYDRMKRMGYAGSYDTVKFALDKLFKGNTIISNFGPTTFILAFHP